MRERSLEDQRHSLEIALSTSQQEVKDLNVRMTGYEGKINELKANVSKMELVKKDLEGKLSTVCSLLREVRLV